MKSTSSGRESAAPIAPITPITPPTRLRQAAKELGVPEATLRSIRYWSKERRTRTGKPTQPNGFAPAFIKLGRAIYVDITVFLGLWKANGAEGDLS